MHFVIQSKDGLFERYDGTWSAKLEEADTWQSRSHAEAFLGACAAAVWGKAYVGARVVEVAE